MTDLTKLTLTASPRRPRQEDVQSVRADRRIHHSDRKSQSGDQRLRSADARSRARASQGKRQAHRRQQSRSRSKACRSATRICSAPKASAPPRARRSSMISSRSMNRPSARTCGTPARSCSANSTTTSSRWARRTRPAPSAMSCRRGGARARTASPRHDKLVPGGSSGGSSAAVAADSVLGCNRNRYRRINPPAGSLDRHRWHQADLWPVLALGHRGVCVVARSGGADRQDRARRGLDAESHGQPRPQGHDVRRRAGAGLRSGAARRASKACASACRRNTASTACRPKSPNSGTTASRG